MAWLLVPPSPSLAVTVTSYTLFAPASVGASKFGATRKLNTPPAVIANRAASAPPVMLNVTVAPASGSVAVTVVTAVWFSGALAVAALVIVGASFTFVTVTAMAWLLVPPSPSLAVTVTSYTFLAPASVGASKFGATTTLTTPPAVPPNFAAFPYPTLFRATVAPASGSVAVTVVTAVWFSGALAVAALVIVGASFTFVRLIVITAVSLSVGVPLSVTV